MCIRDREEALSNADSPTNLSWLINNSETTAHPKTEEKHSETASDFLGPDPGAPSYKEFTLSLYDDDGT